MFKSPGKPSGRVRGNLDREVQSVFIKSMNTPSRFGSADGGMLNQHRSICDRACLFPYWLDFWIANFFVLVLV
jgi:hypothetical protein